ncbi:MAG: hypothetical protein LBK75_08450 [Oscillospiraceae bacterium]|jgi:hypothetical protein|nr:hypothetical protein [Oscillospiraceae bacterium]
MVRPKLDGTSGTYYYKIWENSSNVTQANAFKDSVHTMAVLEASLASKTTTAAISVVFTGILSGMAVASAGILSPAAIAAIISTAALTGTAATAGVEVANQNNNCMMAIDACYYATDNMHF